MSRPPLLPVLVVLLLLSADVTAQVDRADPVLPVATWRGLPVVRGRLLVGFERGWALLDQHAAHTQLGARPLAQVRHDVGLVDVGGGDLDAAIAAYGTRPGVAFVEPDVLHLPTGVPDDPKWSLQWALTRVRAEQAWESARGDASTVVAILDSGVRTDHPDLAAHYAWGFDLYANDADPTDVNGHGTHCAGIAAAVTDNGAGIAGAAWSCRFAAYRCGDASFPTSALVAAIDDAVAQGAHVLSMSWGSPYNSPSIRSALQDAAAAGCVLVAAAGNDDSTAPFYPAAQAAVLGVASSAPDDTRSSFSNHGSWVSVAAPGQSIYSTWKNGSYAYLSGTSMATPLVAGQAALLYAALGGERSPAHAALVRSAIESSAVDVGSWVAHGRVDFPGSLEELGGHAGPSAASLQPTAVAAFGGDEVTLHGSGLLGATSVLVAGQPAEFVVHDDRTLAFAPPPAQALGSAPVVVHEGVLAAPALALDVQATHPPRLAVPSSVPAGEALEWTFGGAPHAFWALALSATPATVTVQGWPVLQDVFVAALGVLDDAGLGSIATTVPHSLAGLTFSSQVLAGPGWFEGATNVVTTTITP